jgi:hypothetical protein
MITGFERIKLAVLVSGTGGAIALSGLTIAADPSLLRVVLAVLIIGAMILVSLRSPKAVAVLTLCSLPLLALGRRLLIPVAGWTPWDALLVLAPVVSVILAHRLFLLEPRPVAKDRLSKLVGLLLLLALLESLNPESGGLSAGLTGLLFAAAPLAWFFIGRELGDRRLVTAVLASTVVVGVAVALYGLWQTAAGLPTWDAAWQSITGYAALSVQGSIRAFGTFSSSGEYATFLGIAFVVAFTAVLHGRLLALAALPILGYALFLESSRTVVVLVLLAIAVAVGLRTGKATVTALTVLVAVAAAWGTISFLGPKLTDTALRSGNPFIAHQAAGLLNPFDPKQSTLPIHQRMVLTGVLGSFDHPLGLGLAAINPQAGRLTPAASASTEVDISNAFVALGPLGGLIFLLVIFFTFWQGARLALSHKQLAALAALGLFIATLGQWLNGGYYAVAPLLWFLVGWVNREWLEQRASQPVPAERDQVRRPIAVRWPSPATRW